MKNLFNSVKMTKPKSSGFDLTHDVKTSLSMGNLTPIMCMEVVPGDNVKISAESMVRFSPLVAPVMHRVDVTVHYFFCPNRILWPNWEKFITNTKIGSPAALPAFPRMAIDDSNYTKLMNYLGIPDPNIYYQGDEIVSALPFAAYQMIYNEYYRDQNLISPVPFELSDGVQVTNFTDLVTLRKRAWEHDYFTSCLPFAQKGDPVEIPVGTLTDVPVKWDKGGLSSTSISWQGTEVPGSTSQNVITDAGSDPNSVVPSGHLYAETSLLDLAQTTINDLRLAYRLQEFYEKLARGGSRLTEVIRTMFGVKSRDERLQRPEYITGVKTPIVISEVLNTSDTANAPQGNMAGHGIGVMSGKVGNYFCPEHGYIIGIMSVTPKTAYQQGMPKHFTKWKDPYQFYWPTFANIGEQPVQQREVLAFQSTADQDDTFGYVPRYAEYKFMNSMVTGDFQTTLDHWHLGRQFNSQPLLNQQFVECVPDDRIFAVNTNDDQIYVHILNKVFARRLMPKYGTPTF